MQAELIFTGNELLHGFVLNTHAQFLGMELARLGIKVTLHTAVGDDWDTMKAVVSEAHKRSELIIITGGLGPTTDDITKEVVAEVLGVPMVIDEASLAQMRAFFAQKGQELPALFTRQACFPAGSRVLPNYKGTAPGALIERDGRVIVILPGPPRELEAMFKTSVEPYLAKMPGRKKILRTRHLKLTGIAEYAVQDLLKGLGGQGNPSLAYVAKPGEVHVRVYAQHDDAATAEKMVDELLTKVRDIVGEYVFAVDDEKPEEIAGQKLLAHRMNIAVAESCTAGMLGAKLTEVPGSSRYFLGGTVVYSNFLKEKLLGVPPEVLKRYGAVSEETALSMADGVRRLAGSDLGLGITGIAGPEGGTDQKPVGLVYIALTSGSKRICRRYVFPGTRHAVRKGAVNASLQMINNFLT
ncbi:MAG: competence/damage-inducible protein A [Peptococcaceae bacterium]|nr:competence/damage-inducible protein A [Peptococcaceae bacterium]